MTPATHTGTAVQVNRVFIRATPEAVWEAITRPEWTRRYGYHSLAEYDLRPGGAYVGRATPEMQAMGMPAVVVDGEVIECDPPRRLVHTWRFLWSEEIAAEGPTTVTFDIEPADGGLTRLTVTHELPDAPQTQAMVAGEVENAGGGWPYILSDMKTLLETGLALEDTPPA